MKQPSWIVIVAALALTGCGASYFSAETLATYEISPDGKKVIVYKSNKEQQGLVLDLQESDGKIKSVKIQVDKASTQESVIAAAAQQMIIMGEVLKSLLPLIEKAAAMGAGT